MQKRKKVDDAVENIKSVLFSRNVDGVPECWHCGEPYYKSTVVDAGYYCVCGYEFKDTHLQPHPNIDVL